MSGLHLRDYQLECVAALHREWSAGHTRVACVLPTGAGKTVVFAHLSEDWLKLNPGKRVLVLAHTDELIDQAVKKIRQVAPHRTIGIVKAERNEVHAEIIVASVQSLRSDVRMSKIRSVGLVVCDEAHHCTAITYRNIFTHFGVMNGSVPLAGFTATLARSDTSKLSDIIQTVAYKKDIAFMQRRGYLLPCKGKQIIVPELDLSKVKKSAGDYQDGALGDAMMDALAPEIVAKSYSEYACGKRGIGFAPSVASAYAFSEAFNDQGIPSDVIHGSVSKQERHSLLARRLSGEIQVLWGVAVLTEGFDAPDVEVVIVARPTKSAVLFQQMVGRGLRPDLTKAPADRGYCLIIEAVAEPLAHDLRSLCDLSLADDNPYDVEPDDIDAELEQLVEEEREKDSFAEPQMLYAGPVEVVDFDPLARDSGHAWGMTSGGTYILTAGPDFTVFLVPDAEPGTYGIAYVTVNRATYAYLDCSDMEPYVSTRKTCSCKAGHVGAVGGWANGHRELSLDMALAWGVEVAEELGGTAAHMFGTKGKAWRKKPPSEPQIGLARRLGIVVPVQDDGVTPAVRMGVLADMITVAKASQRVDPVVNALISQMKVSV